ncbi:recombinase family protein [Streptomyces sp. NPDC090442]|uniref:recombinase family protein n=1 Tax=Streptomyces sp. NPDC090442 TaxID=3365962 RepID=UPI0037FB7613
MQHESGPDPATLIDLFCRKSKAVKSRASRGGKKELSVAAQEARGKQVAAQLGLTVRHVWREVGSASRFRKKGARTDQDQALATIEAGEVSALWCFRLDRWDRRGAGSILRIIEPADGKPRRLLFGWDEGTERPELDSTNKRDRGELIRRAEDAREETEHLSERVRNTKEHQRAGGEWTQGRIPYGLELAMVEVEDEDGEVYEERRLQVTKDPAGDPQGRTKADIARLIHTLPVTDGLSRKKIATQLTAEGVPTPTGTGAWATATVTDIINNPVYAGWQITGRQGDAVKSQRRVFRDEHGKKVSVMVGPPLVTDEQKRAAQNTSKGTSWAPRVDGKTPATHPLSTRSFCEGCEGAMVWQGDGYGCWRKSDGQGEKGCPAPAYARGVTIEGYVFRKVVSRLTNAERDDPIVIEAAKRWMAHERPEEAEGMDEAQEALKDAETALKRVWEDRKRGRYDGPNEAFFDGDLDEATELVLEARKEVETLRGTTAVDVSFLMDPASIEDAWLKAGDHMRRTLVGLAIDEIWVHKAPGRGVKFVGDERVTINWAGEPKARKRKYKRRSGGRGRVAV